jgi:hypothetical protein
MIKNAGGTHDFGRANDIRWVILLGRMRTVAGESRKRFAALNNRDGEVTDVELVATYAFGDLAGVVEVERGKVGAGEGLVPACPACDQFVSSTGLMEALASLFFVLFI